MKQGNLRQRLNKGIVLWQQTALDLVLATFRDRRCYLVAIVRFLFLWKKKWHQRLFFLTVFMKLHNWTIFNKFKKTSFLKHNSLFSSYFILVTFAFQDVLKQKFTLDRISVCHRIPFKHFNTLLCLGAVYSIPRVLGSAIHLGFLMVSLWGSTRIFIFLSYSQISCQ